MNRSPPATMGGGNSASAGAIWRTSVSPAFQTAYLERHPGLLEDLAEPGLMLEVDPDNDLVASLHANGVLPEAIRAPFVRAPHRVLH